MCCFSMPVQFVADTNIFARPNGDNQVLVYEMRYGAADDLAMILPLPVPPLITTERAVRFISLEQYPTFFDEMSYGFVMSGEFGRSTFTRGFADEPPTPLIVHDVGSFEASFVPHMDDFNRLDKCFRISPDVWANAPEYADYGFAVFKLKPARDTQIHPIAFEFPRRDTSRLFFPTVHVHDGEIHDEAEFDHTLYCQVPPSLESQVAHWERSEEAAGTFMDSAGALDLIWPREPIHRVNLDGMLANPDSWVGRGVDFPNAGWGLWATCQDCGQRRRAGDEMKAGRPCWYCGGLRVEESRVGPPPRRGRWPRGSHSARHRATCSVW